jgi:hypothetical protein
MSYCTICGKPATAGVYCDECRQMLEKRVNKGLVVTKPAIVSHQDRRQASIPSSPSGSSGSSRPSRPSHSPVSHAPQKSRERISVKGIAIGKDGLPMYCDACGNLLYRDGGGFVCKACGHVQKEAKP